MPSPSDLLFLPSFAFLGLTTVAVLAAGVGCFVAWLRTSRLKGEPR